MTEEQAERLIAAVEKLWEMVGWSTFTISVIGGLALAVWVAR